MAQVCPPFVPLLCLLNSLVKGSSLKEFEEELKESYDVATFIRESDPGFELSVTGETSLPWKGLMDKLESLKGMSEDYKPSDYLRLVEIVLTKRELDLQVYSLLFVYGG